MARPRLRLRLRLRLTFRLALPLLALSLLVLSLSPAHAGGGKPAEHNPKIDSALEQVLMMAAQGLGVQAMGLASNAGIPVRGSMITVVLRLAPDVPVPWALVEAIEQITQGLVAGSSHRFIKVRLPLNSTALSLILRILQLTGIVYVRPPAIPQALAVSEGVALTGAQEYQSLGYRGQGVKIAVIDLGFSGLATAQARGELPANLHKQDYTGTGLETGTAHGTAVAEIIHDMAPEAELYLMKIGDEVDLERAVEDAIRYGVQIINHSVGWLNTNFYDGTGVVDEIAAEARSHGILWVNAAGNYAQRHWSGTFRDSDHDGWCEFAGSDEDLDLYARGGEQIGIYLTWDEWPHARTDYDLYLFGPNGQQVAASERLQTGTEEPTEVITYRAPVSGTYHVKIKLYSGSGASMPRLALFSLNHDLEHAIPQGSIVAPADSPAVMAVGAIGYQDWTTGPAEPYSSQGPTSDGRSKPDICAPDQVLTTTLGRFLGTSAAAPHVAGAAALLLTERPGLGVAQLEAALESSAIPMGSTTVYGAGRLSLRPQPARRPDLLIAGVSYTPQKPAVGDQVTFTVQVRNGGTGAAGEFAVELRDAQGSDRQTVQGLAPGATARLTFTRRIPTARAEYTFTVDPLDQVAESDESNNTYRLTVTASAPAPQPLQLQIEVWTDKRSYRVNERFSVGLEVHPRAYVYVFYVSPAGVVSQLFPNRFSQQNYLEGRYTLPDGGYYFMTSAPAGTAYIHALAVAQPVRLVWRQDPRLADPQAFHAELARRLEGIAWAHNWAEIHVEVEGEGEAPPPSPSPPPVNQPPVARFSFTPGAPTVGQQVLFDASASYDPDGRIVDYAWDFDGDGRIDAHGLRAIHAYPQARTYSVTLTVTDDGGLTGTATRQLTVSPASPPPSPSPPSGLPTATLALDRGCGGRYQVNETIVITYSVSEAAQFRLYDINTAGQLVLLTQGTLAAGQQGRLTGRVVGPEGIETLVLFARTASGTVTTTACSFIIGSPGGTLTLNIDRGPGGGYRPGEPIRFSYTVSEDAALMLYDFEPSGMLRQVGLGWLRGGQAGGFTGQVVGPPGVETAVLVAYTRSGRVLSAAVSWRVLP